MRENEKQHMKMYFLPTQKKDYLFFTIALLTLTILIASVSNSYASATSTAPTAKNFERYDLSDLMNGWKQINPGNTFPDEFVPELNNADETIKTVTVKKGDTLYGVLKKVGVPLQQQRKIVALTSKQKAFRFDKGLSLTLTMRAVPKTKRKELVLLSAKIDKNQKYIARLQPNGNFKASVEPAMYKGKLRYVDGTIKKSFVKDAQYFGLSASLASKAYKLLSKQKKFKKDKVKNSDFEVIYEVYPKGSGVAPRIMYVRLGKVDSLQLFFYEGKNGSGYYDTEGHILGSNGSFKPVKNARMSSGFGYRIHPVLKRKLLHKGTDFAAPTGTPIYAAADGKIDFLGRNGGYGKHIRIVHDKSTRTSYSHMSRYAKGLKKGSKVEAGQVIGYVGSTGRSTGPHLHFEVHKNGKAVDPLKSALMRPTKLKGVELAQFKLKQVRLFLQVAQQRITNNVLASISPEFMAKAAL